MNFFFLIFSLFIQNSHAIAQTVILPVRSLPAALDSASLSYATDNYIFRQLTQGLFYVGDGFNILPRLAKQFQWSNDRKTLTIEIIDALFSDGSEVTADDIKKSVDRCIQYSNQTLLSSVSAVTKVEVVQKKRIIFRLSQVAPLLLDDLAQAECHITKPNNGSYDLLKGAIGIGPYVIQKKTEFELTLKKKNNLFLANPAAPENAVYKTVENIKDVEELAKWSDLLFSDEKKDIVGFQAIEMQEIGAYQLIFNNRKYPFDKKEIRSAVADALDYKLMAKTFDVPESLLQSSLISYGARGFRQKSNLDISSSKKNKIDKTLKEFGFDTKNPLKFNILISRAGLLKDEVNFWNHAFITSAIKASVQIEPQSKFYELHSLRAFDTVRSVKYSGSSEAHRLLSSYFSFSKYNTSNSNAACDKMIKDSIFMNDRERRFNAYRKAEECLIEKQQVLIPLFSIKPSILYLKKEWFLTRTNKYLLYPYWVMEWRKQ